MKKMVSLLTALALLLCAFAALAESDYTYYPELEDYVGTWYVDDYILEIAHSDDDYNALDCVVTRYDVDGKTGARWIYNGCSYDDVGNALASVEIGHRLECEFDGGELISSETIYTDGAAAFALNGDGTLTWTDCKETPGEDEIVFEKAPEDVPNPVAPYEGTWGSGRATLTIEELDDVVFCTVTWGSSASEYAVWEYQAVYDEVADELNTLETGVKSIVTCGEDGEAVSTEVEFEDGAASFKLNGDGTLTWTDYKGTPGENEVVFEKANPVADYSFVTTLDNDGVEAFARAARDAYLEADWETLSTMISYPITLYPDHLVDTPEAFAEYMLGKAPAAEDAAEMEQEDCEALFANGQGICLGSGQIWFLDVNFDGVEQVGEPLLKIIAINGVE